MDGSTAAGSGRPGLAAALCVTLAVLFLAVAEVSLGTLSIAGGWPWPGLELANHVLVIVAYACSVAAAVDCWLSLRGTKHREARSYLYVGGLLVIVACVVGGPAFIVVLLPGAVCMDLAMRRLRRRQPGCA